MQISILFSVETNKGHVTVAVSPNHISGKENQFHGPEPDNKAYPTLCIGAVLSEKDEKKCQLFMIPGFP